MIDVCTWADPGADAYIGSVPAAVATYQDIPADVRDRLRARMSARKYDEIAVIRRDSIEGAAATYTDLRQMHFGGGRVCRTVDRSMWPDDHEERGLVYCEQEHCLIVPTVCRNVSRVTRLSKRTSASTGGSGMSGTFEFAVKVPQEVALPSFESVTASTVADLAVVGPAIAAPTFPVASYFEPTPVLIHAPVTAVPEPPTWWMLLAGFGVVGVLARRNRSEKDYADA
jgi:hypothetical protein